MNINEPSDEELFNKFKIFIDFKDIANLDNLLKEYGTRLAFIDMSKPDNDVTYPTALFLAVASNLTDVVRLLLEKGADVNKTNSLGQTPLFKCNFSNIDILNTLIEYGTNLNHEMYDGSTILFDINGLNERFLKILIENGANINHKNNEQEDPLLYTIMTGDILETVLLIKYGANVNSSYRNNRSPVIYAAGNVLNSINGLDILQVLVDKGANVSQMDDFGLTAWDYYVRNYNNRNDRNQLTQGQRNNYYTVKRLLDGEEQDRLKAISKRDVRIKARQQIEEQNRTESERSKQQILQREERKRLRDNNDIENDEQQNDVDENLKERKKNFSEKIENECLNKDTGDDGYTQTTDFVTFDPITEEDLYVLHGYCFSLKQLYNTFVINDIKRTNPYTMQEITDDEIADITKEYNKRYNQNLQGGTRRIKRLQKKSSTTKIRKTKQRKRTKSQRAKQTLKRRKQSIKIVNLKQKRIFK